MALIQYIFFLSYIVILFFISRQFLWLYYGILLIDDFLISNSIFVRLYTSITIIVSLSRRILLLLILFELLKKIISYFLINFKCFKSFNKLYFHILIFLFNRCLFLVVNNYYNHLNAYWQLTSIKISKKLGRINSKCLFYRI